MKKILLGTISTLFVAVALTAVAAPPAPQDLQLRVAYEFGTDLGVSSSSYNCRFFDEFVFVSQINVGAQGFGRYPSGWGVPSLVVTNIDITEHRTVAPFRGALKSTYLMGASGATPAPATTTFTRYNYDGSNPVTANVPAGVTVESFDWVDDGTVVHNSYVAPRNRIHLAKVTAEPFALAADTRWNANGYIDSTLVARIRTIRTGDVYSNYAYFGNASFLGNANFCALNLTTGAETLLGSVAITVSSGSYGLWTVVERGGYLFVHTTDDGIHVFNMVNATTLGTLVTTYTKSDLDTVTGLTSQYWAFDVAPDASRFVLGGVGKTCEFGPPSLLITRTATEAILAWPSSVTAVAVQTGTNLSFAMQDMDPQPTVVADGKTNSVTVPLSGGEFFRLRRNP